MRQRRIGNVFVIFGILLIFGAMGLTVYNYWDASRAAKVSQDILDRLITEINRNVEEGAAVSVPELNQEMPTEEIDGYLYIGIIEVPSAGICLPVMAEWDYSRLKISPCRYTGAYYSDDLVICAHNYPKHFSSIKWLDLGADVSFTNVKGEVFQYTVGNIEMLQPNAVEQMVSNSGNSRGTQNEWDLTLFTCNMSGRTRCAVRCVRTEDQRKGSYNAIIEYAHQGAPRSYKEMDFGLSDSRTDNARSKLIY